MKRTGLCFILIIIVCSLCANPISTKVLSELWFDDNGHCMIELCDGYMSYLPSEDLVFYNGDVSASIPDSVNISDLSNPVVLDINLLMPELVFSPVEDTLRIDCDIAGHSINIEYMNWGESLTHLINSPLPGQSLVQNLTYYPEGVDYQWVKDTPPTPGTNPYTPQAHAVVQVICTDQDGNPVPNVGIRYNNISPPAGYTDESGVYRDTLFAGRFYIRILHPQTGQEIFSRYQWLEPNQETTFTVQMTITDNADNITPVQKVSALKIYPVPFNPHSSEAICFQLSDKVKTGKATCIKIYNLKGQYVTELTMPRNGSLNWIPGKDIASGVYRVRLISGNRIIENTQFTVIK